MGKKKKKVAAPAPPPPPPEPWWRWLRKPWTVTIAICGAIGALLLNINTILENVRELPSQVRETNSQFVGWLYQDAAWKGYWRSATS